MHSEDLDYSGAVPQHICRPRGYCNELAGRLGSADGDLAALIDELGEIGCDGGVAFRVLRKHLDNEKMPDFSIISMGRIRYPATIDIVIGILRKFTENRDRGGMKRLIDALGVIFFDREAHIGRERFFSELYGFRPLERNIRIRFYKAIGWMQNVAGYKDSYLKEARAALWLQG